MKKTKKISKKELKKKQERTLKNMKQRRKNDYVFLREIIKGKLEYAKEQKQKLVETLEKLQNAISENTVTLYKVDGIIMVLNELLEESTTEKE